MNYNFFDPADRARAIEALGLEKYEAALRDHLQKNTVAIVNGRAIHKIQSRFGELYAVLKTDKAYKTVAEATNYAMTLPLLAPEPVPVITATFLPQAWQNDYAIEVDAEGPTTWDAARDILSLPDAEIRKLRDHDYPTDHLHRMPGAPEWIRNWGGPFEVDVCDSLCAAFGVENPSEITDRQLAEARERLGVSFATAATLPAPLEIALDLIQEAVCDYEILAAGVRNEAILGKMRTFLYRHRPHLQPAPSQGPKPE